MYSRPLFSPVPFSRSSSYREAGTSLIMLLFLRLSLHLVRASTRRHSEQ